MSGSSPLSGHLRITGLVKRDLSSVYVLIVIKEIFSFFSFPISSLSCSFDS